MGTTRRDDAPAFELIVNPGISISRTIQVVPGSTDSRSPVLSPPAEPLRGELSQVEDAWGQRVWGEMLTRWSDLKWDGGGGWARILLCLVMAVVGTAAGASAQIPPNAEWMTIESPNFRLTYAPGLEELGRHAIDRAEIAYTLLSAELAEPPAGKIDIVLTDQADISNGFATPFPSNRITLYARPPVDLPSLGYFNDWIDLVVIHELAHIFHLDATGGIGRGIRRIFGRVPASWPVFPILGTPNWMIEGLATYFESRLTGAGRVRGSYHEMVLRTAALEGGFDSLDEISNPSALWPGGSRSYIYGSLFLDYLSQREGPEVQRELLERTAGSLIPTPFNLEWVASGSTGKSFRELYDEWRSHLHRHYQALADSLSALGLTRTERVGAGGYNTLYPRVGPDGRVAYAAMDGRRSTATRILDPSTGKSRTLSRRNGVGPLTRMGTDALLTTQLEFAGPYRVFGDLYRIDEGGEHRLTHGARLSAPDLAPDGERVIAVQEAGGTNRLVIYDLRAEELRPITTADPSVHWALPRWSPTGERIAVGRWEGGEHDVVILDSLGMVRDRVGAGGSLDMAPTWSPDGRYLVFSSDRNGIPNLYAYDLHAVPTGSAGVGPEAMHPPGGEARAGLYQVTNLLTGAFFPEISPAGDWIYFSAYHRDGFEVERIAFDPSSWTRASAEPQLAEWRVGPAASEGLSRVASEGAPERASGPARRYSPIHSLLPRYWLPTLRTDRVLGPAIGVRTSGHDLVGRHSYSMATAYLPTERVAETSFHYSYAGLGQPIFEISGLREWDGVFARQETEPSARLLERRDELRLATTVRRQRYRSAAWLTLGGELVRRDRELRDAESLTLSEPSDRLAGGLVRVAFSNYQIHPLSLSAEDGVGIALTARRRWDLRAAPGQGSLPGRDQGYGEVSGQMTGFRSLDLPGFANHIIAFRAAANWRSGPGARPFGVGGASGQRLDLGVESIGPGHRLLPIRGFRDGDRRGTLGWSSTIEYRFPISYLRFGRGLWPLFLDRVAGSVFVDAGNATCTAEESTVFTACSPGGDGPLVSAGAELITDLRVLLSMPLRLRTGTAFPVRGGRGRPELYLLLGLPF